MPIKLCKELRVKIVPWWLTIVICISSLLLMMIVEYITIGEIRFLKKGNLRFSDFYIYIGQCIIAILVSLPFLSKYLKDIEKRDTTYRSYLLTLQVRDIVESVNLGAEWHKGDYASSALAGEFLNKHYPRWKEQLEKVRNEARF